MAGIIYILTNAAMPGLVKIGCSTAEQPGQHISELYTEGVPLPFECVKAVRVDDEKAIERALHIAFAPSRINEERAFFQMQEDQVIVLLNQLASEDVTVSVCRDYENEDSPSSAALKRMAARRPQMDFDVMGIPKGARLTAAHSDEEAEVLDNKKVRFRGISQSLTSATRQLLDVDYSPRPTSYWMYDGVLLQTLYDCAYPASED